MTDDDEGGAFFIRRAGKIWFTPLFLVLLVGEDVDLIFAVDSIPAVIAVTQDPFLAYTSNIAAILSLRALYFLWIKNSRAMATSSHANYFVWRATARVCMGIT